ncbi:MAG: cobalamin biosynthesis protein [Litoreibacter sp.]|nr:cobalamin biosynthesis protein [Litoreibacter sp.]
MSVPALLVIAMLLDAALGEPKWLWDRVPHPAVLMGRLIGRCDARFNTGQARKLKGIAVIAVLVAGALALGHILSSVPDGGILEVVLVAVLLAQRSLADHVRDVGDALRLSIGDGRKMVARIVGRDVSALDNAGVARGAIESAAENLSDGVIAPAFWYLLLGLPGILAYKLINTADSMIGYLTPRHEAFGWAAARLDDVVNWIPARLTALLIAAGHANPGVWRTVKRDANKHRSPNAGWPEAAMAGVLDVALSGPRSYEGVLREEPFVNEAGRHDLGSDDVERAVSALWRAWALALVLVAALGLALGALPVFS